MIGRTVKSESDFTFNPVKIDEYDPETIIARHNVTNFLCKIKKSFKGALKINENTARPLINEKIIQDYNSENIEIDVNDPHLAYLYVDNTRVKARRTFVGGVIIGVLNMNQNKRKTLKIDMTNVITEESDSDLSPDPGTKYFTFPESDSEYQYVKDFEDVLPEQVLFNASQSLVLTNMNSELKSPNKLEIEVPDYYEFDN